MATGVVNLGEKFALIDERWSPRIAARINDMYLKLVRVKGEFVWHTHTETDEFFYIHRGELTIELKDRGSVDLHAGEFFVVPRDVEHRPIASEDCELVIIEPAGTLNTGDVGGSLTAPEDRWV
jgi:mannose-6-phosphate isomerase-like protein (cupin superfamily)